MMLVLSGETAHMTSFKTAGANIAFQDLGNPSGLPLLMLHGGFGTMRDFDSLVSALGNHRIVLMDARGQGSSTLGDGMLTYRRIQQDAEQLLDHLNIQSAAVLGFSDGAMVAHLMAIASPSRVTKLISIAGPWKKDDLSLIRDSLQAITPAVWKERFSASYRLYEQLQPGIDFPELVRQLKHMWLDETPSGGYPGDAVKQIRCPTLIIRGDDDHLFTRQSAAELSNNINGAHLLTIPYAGHEAHKDQEEVVTKMITLFFSKDK